MGLMLFGAAGAVALLWMRRSRSGGDSMWILDDDSDIEPVGRWHEGDSRAEAADDMIGEGGKGGKPGEAHDSGPDATPTDRKDSPANRWP